MINHIRDNIYIGSRDDTLIHKNEFDEIFTCADDVPIVGSHYYPLTDGESDYINNLLISAINDLIETRNKNLSTKILVHCLGGNSRSLAVVAGYLIKKYNFSTDQAIEYIGKIRPTINPYRGLTQLLKKFEDTSIRTRIKTNPVYIDQKDKS